MRQEEWGERENIYACWLCSFPGMGNRQMYRLWELCGGFEAAYYADREKWKMALPEKQLDSLKAYTAKWRPEEEYGRMKEEGVTLVDISDENYPARLKNIPDAPLGLFVKGRLPVQETPAVAVIGARDCSEYGKYVAGLLGKALGCSGMTVISGMARGVDGIGQEAALQAGGNCVAVLGSGVDVCYPVRNKMLYDRLQAEGAVVSAYPMGTPARAQNFPPRNRIVSGLADVVAVVEAGVKSGTLITVDMALEQGREVYAVPGRLTDRLSDGCNQLIRQGAEILYDVDEFIRDVWELWEGKACRKRGGVSPGGRTTRCSKECGMVREPENPGGRQTDDHAGRRTALSPELAAIYGILDFYPRSVEEISMSLPADRRDKHTVARLMRLCMENLAVQASPGHFCRKG